MVAAPVIARLLLESRICAARLMTELDHRPAPPGVEVTVRARLPYTIRHSAF